MTLKELIEKVEYDINDYSHPPSYMDSTDYIKYKAKADYAETVLDMLMEFTKSVERGEGNE